MTLASLTVIEWAVIATGSWTVLAVVAAPRIGRLLKRHQPEPPVPPPAVQVFGDWFEDVPPSRHSDADWLSVWPTEGDDLNSEFFAIVDRETRWFV